MEVVGRRRRDLREGVVVVDGREVGAVVTKVAVGRARKAGTPRQSNL